MLTVASLGVDVFISVYCVHIAVCSYTHTDVIVGLLITSFMYICVSVVNVFYSFDVNDIR